MKKFSLKKTDTNVNNNNKENHRSGNASQEGKVSKKLGMAKFSMKKARRDPQPPVPAVKPSVFNEEIEDRSPQIEKEVVSTTEDFFAKKSKKPGVSDRIVPDDNSNLESAKLEQLFRELASENEGKSISPQKGGTLSLSKEPDAETYARVPISGFGDALVRGMGWNDD